MGQRSYLCLQNKKQEVQLFEANNTLPFFWLLLADPETMERRIQDWRTFTRFQQNHSEAATGIYPEQHNTGLILSREVFERNINRNRPFLQRHFPQATPLFDAFTETIASKFTAGDSIAIDMVQFSAFYDDVEDFYAALEQEVSAISNDQPEALGFITAGDWLGSGSGFAGTDNKAFAELPAYRAALQQRSAPAPKPVYKADKKSRMIYLVILCLCPFFSLLVYHMYRQEGITFKVILTAVLNAGFYLFSIWSVAADITAARKARG